MITKFSISNFKSIMGIEDLELKPLTILTGVNSSGKSNIMEAISFFAQASRFHRTGDQNPTVIAVLRYGDLKTYPRQIEEFIVYKKDRRRKVSLEINLNSDRYLTKDIEASLTQSDEARRYIFLKKNQTEIETVGYSFSFKLSDRTHSQGININGNRIIEVRSGRGQSPVVVFPKNFREMNVKHSLESILTEDVFSSTKSHPIFDVLSKIAQSIIIYIRERAERVYFISGERGKIDPEVVIPREPERAHTPSWIGCNGQHLVEILSRCFTREPEKAKEIQRWANRFQLPNVRAGYIGRGILESNFKDSILNTDLNSTLAGFGSRQILSIITQIFWSDPGDIIMIEEPEISLHPKNQVLLHELFSEAISQEKQIICSTHSPFFVLALSKIVKKKLLTLDDIAVYHVEKREDGTHARALKLNKHGFIVSGIPSFMKVEEDLFRDWSESLEESPEEE